MVDQEEIKQDEYNYNYPSQSMENTALMDQFSPFNIVSQNQIQINVGDPIKRTSVLKDFYVYNIKGQDQQNGAFDTYRRYNEFFVLRQILVQRWPGCYIPLIPPKKSIGNKDEQVVEDRKRHLNYFVHKLANISYLYNSEEFQLFLRSKMPDLEKLLEKLPKLSVKEIVDKYKSTFEQLNGKDINSDTTIKISHMLGFLKKAKTQLHTYRLTTQKIAFQKNIYNQKLMNLFDQLLPLYEGQCFTEYIQGNEAKMIFCNEKGTPKIQVLRTQLQEQKGLNPFLFVYDMMCYEYQDCEAFIEAISQKDLWEKKKLDLQNKIRDQQEELQSLYQGKTTISSFFSTGSVEEKKQNTEFQILQNNQELEQISLLIGLITGILGFIEIDLFKESKIQIYYAVIKSVAALESLQTLQLNDIWGEMRNITQELLDK